MNDITGTGVKFRQLIFLFSHAYATVRRTCGMHWKYVIVSSRCHVSNITWNKNPNFVQQTSEQFTNVLTVSLINDYDNRSRIDQESYSNFALPVEWKKVFEETLQTLARDRNRPLDLRMWKVDDDYYRPNDAVLSTGVKLWNVMMIIVDQ
jgi:hypothetical protein